MNKLAENIIRKIASIQLEAISSLDKEGVTKDNNFFKFIEAPSSEEWEEVLVNLKEVYIQLKKFPSTIKLLSEYQLLICSHILYRMEDFWRMDYPTGVYLAWNEINRAIERYHPEFKLIKI